MNFRTCTFRVWPIRNARSGGLILHAGSTIGQVNNMAGSVRFSRCRRLE